MAERSSRPGRTRRLAAVGCCLAAGSALGSAPNIDVRVEPGALTIRASAAVEADAATAWRVLVDYARYPEFVPGVSACRVVRRDGPEVTVEQSGSAFLAGVAWPVSLVYEIEERPPDSIRSSARVPGVGTLRSRYHVEPRAHGVELDYEGRLSLATGPLDAIRAAAARETASRQFAAMADEIERSARTGRDDGHATRVDAAQPRSADADRHDRPASPR